MLLRPASPLDAEPVAAIEFAVAHHAFAELDPRRVAVLELDDLVGEWRARLDPADDGPTVIAELGGRVVGAAAWRTDAAPVTAATLTHLLVHPAAQNSGVGSALLAAAEDALRAAAAGSDAGPTARAAVHPDAWWATGFLERREWSRAADGTGVPAADGASLPSWTKAL
jgi:GNAT superfamily N-acetyltransferase